MACALCAASIAALCAATPRQTYAVEPETVTVQTEPAQTIDVSGITERLTNIDVDMNINANKSEEKLNKIGDSLSTIQDELTPKDGKSTNDYLSSIEDKLSTIAGNSSEPEIAEQKSAKTRAGSIAFVAYANAPSSGTYVNYANGYLSQLQYGDNYVFLQDTSSSYVFAFGDLSPIDTNTISGNMIKWVRWYYSNNNVGYVMETGQSDITISCNNHVILSSLPKWPSINGAADEQLRKEVGFYALVLVSCSVLRDVWSFLVRMRSASLTIDGKG